MLCGHLWAARQGRDRSPHLVLLASFLCFSTLSLVSCFGTAPALLNFLTRSATSTSEAIRLGTCPKLVGRRCARLSTLMQESVDDEPLKKKKEMPQHVQDVLNQETTIENTLENRRTVDDFKGLGKQHQQKSGSLERTELYVRGVPWGMSGKELRDLFSAYSPKYARVMKHPKFKDRSLGYGFVGFGSTGKAQEAMQAMEGHIVQTKEEGKKPTTLRISYATEKGKQRELSSKKGKSNAQQEINIRKQQLASRDLRKVAMTLDEMPRRWKAMADQKTLDTGNLEKLQNAGDDGEIDDARAEQAVEEYLTLHRIEDVSSDVLSKEAKEAKDSGDPALEMIYGSEDDDDDEEGWTFVPDGADEGGEKMKLEDFIEDEEEERRNWEEYQRMQRINKDRLKEEGDAKPSGALRSGQKKIKTWSREDDV